MGAPGQRGARHRHLRHAHGVVLRAEGAAVLRDRLPAARRRRVGPLLRGQRHRPLPRVGRRDRARARSARSRRGGSPPASSRCAPTTTATITGYTGRRRDPGSATASGSSTRTCPTPGTPTQPVEAGLHGQRLRPDAAPRLRHAARHARRRRPHACTSTPRERPSCSDRSALLGAAAAARRCARRPDLDGPGRHDHRRLAGARARRRRARRAARTAAASTWPVRPLAGRAGARPGVRRGRARAPGRARRAAGALPACSSTTRCRRAARGRPARQRRPARARRRRCADADRRRRGSSTTGTCARVGAAARRVLPRPWRPARARAGGRRAPRRGGGAAGGRRGAGRRRRARRRAGCTCCSCSTSRRACRRRSSPGRPGRWR